MLFDMRPDREGWTVYETGTGRPALLDDLALVGLDHEAADELVGLLNRAGRPRRPKRLSDWPLTGVRDRSRSGTPR